MYSVAPHVLEFRTEGSARFETTGALDALIHGSLDFYEGSPDYTRMTDEGRGIFRFLEENL